MVETKKVNLSAKKTEARMACKAIDRFFLHATPVWFKWLEWMIIIGAIQVIAIKHKIDFSAIDQLYFLLRF